MKRVATYNRVSTKEQALEGFSLKAQTVEMNKRIAEEGWLFQAAYTDDGYSGSTIQGRPNMRMLLADAKQRKFDVLIIHRIDRLSRNLQEALQIVEMLMEHGIQLVSISENLDLTSSMGKLLFQLMGTFAEFERETISDRVKHGLKERAKAGKYSGAAVLGYNFQDGFLQVNEQEADIIRFIFEQANENKGYMKIVNLLNANGMKTKKGCLFSIATVREILNNPLYIGKIRYNLNEDWTRQRRKGSKENVLLVDGEHEGIISTDLWENVQKLKALRSRKTTSSRPYILSGLMRCPICKYKMVANKSKSSAYYTCSQYHNKGREACSPHLFNADVIERIVEGHVMEYLSEFPSEEFQKVPTYNSTKVSKKSLDNDMSKLTIQLAEGTIDYLTYEKEISLLQEAYEAGQQQVEVPKDISFRFLHMDRKQQRDFLKHIIEEVVLSIDNETGKVKLDRILFYQMETIWENKSTINKFLRGEAA